MKYCYVIRIKKVTLRSTSPIRGDHVTREHHLLEKRGPKETDLLGGIYLDKGKALDFCDYCNRILSQKEWMNKNPEGVKNDYYVEIRKFYIETQPLWD